MLNLRFGYLLSPCDLPVFDRQYACILLEQFSKTARSGVTDHLRDLSHREIRVDQKMFCLTHAPTLDIFRNGTSGILEHLHCSSSRIL